MLRVTRADVGSAALEVPGISDATNESVDARVAEAAIDDNGSAMVITNLQPGSVAIVKIGEKSVKVLVK